VSVAAASEGFAAFFDATASVAFRARIVELRYFAGLSVEETAEVMAISPRTVKGDWAMAKAWLRSHLGRRAV
jgi:DNA-directed RNA polymerase specialized sigma24 family protein